MAAWKPLVSGLGLGATAMYFLDARSGHRRRVEALQQLGGQSSRFAAFLDVACRDLGHRAVGIVGASRYRLRGGEVDEQTLVARVAAKVGRYVSHPKAIGVLADEGTITLRGPILRHEVESLLHAVAKVPGVKEVRDELEAHATPANLPDLQGGAPRLGHRPDLLQESWSPATRLLAGTAGAMLGAAALRRRTGAVPLLAAGSLALLGRSVANQPLKRAFGLAGGRRGIDLQKTLHIAVPIHEAFDFFADFERFPLYLRNVLEVRALGGRRYLWCVRGPLGTRVKWTALVTRAESHRLIAWKSERAAPLGHAGMIRFEPVSDRSARVTVQISYNPPGGILAHALACLVGASPKREFEEDLVRAKTFLETGQPAHDAARNWRSSPLATTVH